MKKLVFGILIIFLLSLIPVSATVHTCSVGPVGNLGIVPVSYPVSFAPGETLNVQVDVTNSDPSNDVAGVILQAVIMNDNTNSEVARVTSSQQNVPMAGSSSFTVNPVIPSANVPVTDTYTLYTKAYEFGNESIQCAQDSAAVISISHLVVTKTNPSNGDPLQPVSGTVIIDSSLSTIPIVNLVPKDFISGANVIPASSVTLGSTSLTNVQAGSSQTVSVTINIPASQTPGLYVGDVEVSDGADTKTARLQFSVNSKSQFNVVESGVVISGEDDSTRTRDIKIKNTGNTLLSNFNFAFAQADFSDSGRDIQLSFSDPVSLSSGEEKPVSIDVIIPSGIDEDDYIGVITVTSGAVTDTFTLTIRVLPELCKEGEVGNLLEITEVDLKEDDLELGDILKADVEVTNLSKNPYFFSKKRIKYPINRPNIIPPKTSLK